MGGKDGRFKVERKTEINAPCATDSPWLAPASLVQGWVWNANLEISKPEIPKEPSMEKNNRITGS